MRVLVVLAVYVVPLAVAVGFLLAHDLAEVALALLAVEATVVALVLWARRGPRRQGVPSRPAPVGPPRTDRRQAVVVVAGIVAVTAGTVLLAVLGAARG